MIAVMIGRGITFMGALAETDPRAAVIVAVVAALTGFAVPLNVTVLCPPGTVTVGGTVTAALSLLSGTTRPSSGATPVRVTRPRSVCPAAIVEAANRMDEMSGRTVKLVTLVPLPEGVVTLTGPVRAVAGMVAVIDVSSLTVNMDAAPPLNDIAVSPVKPVPVSVTTSPGWP